MIVGYVEVDVKNSAFMLTAFIVVVAGSVPYDPIQVRSYTAP